MQESNKLYLNAFIAFVVGFAVAYMFGNKAPDPLVYEHADFIKVSVSHEKLDYDREQFAVLAAECGTKQNVEHLDRLAEKFKGVKKTVYKFKYAKDGQEPNTYIVTRIPNNAGYGNMADFQTDFNICAAGAEMYPKMLNSDWLVFQSACGTGFADGSGRPVGCEEVRKVIEPSLELR